MSDPSEKINRPFLIGVTGGSASGKTSVCFVLKDRINLTYPDASIEIISQDSFYKPLTPTQLATVESYDFDDPSAFDHVLTFNTLRQLLKAEPTVVPGYDFTTHSRTPDPHTIERADIILFEGIMAFYPPDLRQLFDLKLFVHCDDDIRLLRRIRRDQKHRGRSISSILHQYETFVKPAFDDYISTTQQYADVIIPRGASNRVAIKVVESEIIQQLQQRTRAKPSPRQLADRQVFYEEDPGNVGFGTNVLDSMISKLSPERPAHQEDISAFNETAETEGTSSSLETLPLEIPKSPKSLLSQQLSNVHD